MHSWLVLSQSDPRPLYLQIKGQIQRRVAAGDLPPGAELPSIRQLAAELAVSVITIKRAYLELEREGTICTRQGKGSFISEQPDVAKRIAQGELTGYLEQAVELGKLFELSKTELQRRLAEIYEKQSSRSQERLS